MKDQTIAFKLAKFIAEDVKNMLPERVLERGVWYVMDTVGCTLLGASTDSAAIIRQYICDEDRNESCTVLGSNVRASAALAALANSVACHAMDYDDVGEGGHASAVVFPAALAAAEECGSSGEELLKAYCVGMEVGGKVDRVLMSNNGAHYKRGWHNTGTSGTVGAAAACAYIYGLSTEQTVHAISHAANVSAGLKKSFGSMSKHMNAGHASKEGVMSAKLARLGFQSRAEMLDAPAGFFDCFCDGYDISLLDALGKDWSFDHNRIQKLYASCGFSHRGICAVLDNLERVPKDYENIRHVTIELPEEEGKPLTYTLPQTGTEGSFSAEYTIAAAIIDRTVELRSFTDEQVLRPAVQSLMEKMERKPFAGGIYTGTEKVTIEMNDGRVICCECDDFAGGFRRPLTKEQLQAKFLDCASHSIRAEKAESVFDMLIKIRQLSDVRALAKAITSACFANSENACSTGDL